MLACVCRPVNSSLPKPPISSAPQKRPPIVVTCEPRIATATILKKKVNYCMTKMFGSNICICCIYLYTLCVLFLCFHFVFILNLVYVVSRIYRYTYTYKVHKTHSYVFFIFMLVIDVDVPFCVAKVNFPKLVS